jgi:hypothetical protein
VRSAPALSQRLDKPRLPRQVGVTKPPLTSFAVAILGFCAGATVSFFTLPIWIIPLIETAREGGRSDWLGFAGAIIGSTLTSVFAILTLEHVRRAFVEHREARG